MLLSGALLIVACGSPPESLPCEGLVYKEHGLSREEYRPCAAAMVAALDRAEQYLVAMFDGESGARLRALSEVRLLKRMMTMAGGRKMWHESWDDDSLNDLNRAIFTASYQYEAAALAPDNHRDFENGRRNHAEAARILRSLQ